MSNEQNEYNSTMNISSKKNGYVNYYQIGRRPLDMLGGEKVYDTYAFNSINIYPEHIQFISHDGKNFGMQGDGIVRDDFKNLERYSFDSKQYSTTKYNAECVDQARTELEKEWEKTRDVAEKVSEYPGFPEDFDDSWRYNLVAHNCQDYVEEVLKRAESIAKKKGVPFIIENAPQLSQERRDSDDAHPGKVLYPYMK